MKDVIRMMEDLITDIGIKTVTICGKVKYEDKMRYLAASLENDAGWNVLFPINIQNPLIALVNDPALPIEKL